MQTLDFSSLRALTHLTITGNDHFNPNLNKFPKTLMELTIFGQWTGTLDALPSSLKELHILGDFNEPLYCLPISLTYLEVRLQYYSYPIRNLPKSIKGLYMFTIGNEFNHNLNLRNNNITYLKLGINFNQPLYDLPPTSRLTISPHPPHISSYHGTSISLSTNSLQT